MSSGMCSTFVGCVVTQGLHVALANCYCFVPLLKLQTLTMWPRSSLGWSRGEAR